MRNQTQEWLIQQVRKRSGMYMDSSLLNKLMIGARNSPELEKHIQDVLEMKS